MSRPKPTTASGTVPEEDVRAFLRERDLEAEWNAWRARREAAIEPPEGAGIDFAPDMRDRRKGDRRDNPGRRSSDRGGA